MGSAPSIGGIGERTEQQRDVMVPLVGDREGHGDLREEHALARCGRIVGNIEPELIRAGLEPRLELGDPPVVVRRTCREYDGLLGGDPGQPDRNTLGGPTKAGVENVSADGTHDMTLPRRSRAILRSSSRTTAASVASSWVSRARRLASISAADRPVAQMRKTRSNRCSYSRLPSASAARSSGW